MHKSNCNTVKHADFTPRAMVPPMCPNPNMQHPETVILSAQRTGHSETRLNTPQTTRNESNVFMLWACAWILHVFTCMWCMHAGYVLYVCVVVCIAFTLYYKMHLSTLFVCVRVSYVVWTTLQMVELLSMSASDCDLWMFMICCANIMNASTWWPLLSDTWTSLDTKTVKKTGFLELLWKIWL